MSLLAQPLKLPNGVVLKNRIGKAPLTEGLADEMNRATARHVSLYRRWAEGGAAVVVTGNVQVDRRYLERPGNVAIDDNGGMEALRAYAKAGTANGTELWMQISHPGRQTPRRVCDHPVAPSAVPLALPASAFAPPRAMTAEEVADVPRRFAHTAAVALEAGFTGVQIHAAHGYLLSQFLTPLVNKREDRWGGDLAARAGLLLDVVRTVRATTAPGFCISVKLNSSDFQQGGFSNEECLQVVKWLGEASVDLIEISGGNYEKPAMMGSGAKESTVRREAYFLEYAQLIKQAAPVPIMLTGGFRSKAAMEAALGEGACDVIGLGRPMCVDTDLPHRLLAGETNSAEAYEDQIVPAKAGLGWFCLQLIAHGDGRDPDRTLSGDDAIKGYVANEEKTAAALVGR
ncbi:NADH:flavin oxidoreductase/NADH oxidase family protein [Reyranella sp.]|uniref:NADH:flavin oxidoreductase/NADH oxidase family protein n=1 Tax=Reyranella sp. TaxID=1929291 RepID=UPI001220AB5D|nr:NADH:flavin oxidoreductase/NADH oxidase family protein [Reyranella sp.]TAJ90380.1 MAG: NADH:flavin oxidoreductase/NADH oxidase family protein [Reyranella sp.]